MRHVLPCLALAAVLGMDGALLTVDAAATEPEEPSSLTPGEVAGSDRVTEARARRSGLLRERFALVGLPYPPGAVFLRAFKHERELELWARPPGPEGDPRTAFRLVHVYPILAASGGLGPKRREGDAQVPEGVYQINRFNPRSRFHLSLGLDYPNASDLARTSDPAAPGADIFIHGGAASLGCLAMGDPAIEELFLAALDARDLGGQSAIPVHVFPCRMTPANWRAILDPLVARLPGLEPFWRELQPVYDRFAREKVPPAVSVGTGGEYRLE